MEVVDVVGGVVVGVVIVEDEDVDEDPGRHWE